MPLFLLLLGGVSVASGFVQLNMSSEGAAADNSAGGFDAPHYFAIPVPIVIHLVSGIVFNLLAPLQFIRSLRQRLPLLHRSSGRLLFVVGLLAASSAIWMNQVYPAFGYGIKYVAVLVFSTGMIVSLVFGVVAILQRKVQCHRAWMMRAVAIGLAPAVQRVILLPVFLVFGEINILVIELVVWVSFTFNLSIVEYFVQRKPQHRLQLEPVMEVKS